MTRVARPMNSTMKYALTLLAILLLAPLAALHAAADADAGRGEFRLFTPAFSGIGTNSLAEVARMFGGGIFGSSDPLEIHRANPAAKTYRYQLGPFIQIKYVPKELVPSSHPFYSEAGTASETLPVTALARQGTNDPHPGMCVWMRQFPPYAAVIPDDTAWLAHLDSFIARHAANYDGMFLDSMGAASVTTDYLLTKPLNPHTQNNYSVATWFAAERVMVDRIKRCLQPNQVLLMQGLVNGETYFGSNSLRPLLAECTGGMAEMIYRGPSQRADKFPSLENWRKDVAMIADMEAKGKSGFYWTKAWVPLTDTQRQQWLRFALCSHLLAAGAHSYFNFDSNNERVATGRGNNTNPCEYYREYDRALKLGSAVDAPLSPAAGAEIYRRRWQHGWVCVNPTSAPASLTLEGNFEDLDGQPVSGMITLTAHTGQIFLERH